MKSYQNLFLVLFSLFFVVQVQAQNELVSIRSVSAQEYEVSSANGLPFILLLENSKNDGRYNISGGGGTVLNVSDIVPSKTTIRILFEKDAYYSMEDNMIQEYRNDLQWVTKSLQIEETDLKMFTSRPVFTDASLEKLKRKIFEYTTTKEKENIFNQWIDKVNYSVGVIQYLRAIYAASNGEKNEHRSNFLPINIHNELKKR